ncbi:SpoIIIAH-like family protein [Bacillus shivajii]|uniref:SpoIIIAH-like family protein n=1 Tax=Bacillus shivajii TaxID=1983719 RepID=UPI001CFC42AE|nr:SpoIIIAH-like family protein [Bacillus shivajii]UCZ54604.1 SpoIIIAH-like family protein [Bacillus shivajii]
MVLKRQTVWLLTMLSLIIVLSVYYISMDRIDNQYAIDNEEVTGEEMDNEGVGIEGLDEDFTVIELEDVDDVFGQNSQFSNVSAQEMFDTIRLQRQDARARMNEDYAEVIASSDSSPEVQVYALEQYESLQTLSQQEERLETMIRAKGYEDALVITDTKANQVKIYVKAPDLSKAEVVEINMLAYEELGDKDIRVGFQPGDGKDDPTDGED